MRARPGRVLPSVVVGGLLISGLALGAGVAAGASPVLCEYKNATYDISALTDVLTVTDGACKAALTGGILEDLMKGLSPYVAPKAADPSSAAPVPDTSPAPSGSNKPSTTTTTTAPTGGAGTKSGTAVQASTPAPLATAPPPAVAAPAALGAAGPVGALPPLAGIAPAGLASSLFGANTYDPGLLFGSPLGNAASALYSPKADSDVTTVSQAQALITPGGGYGTPVTIGVIILACLIGFAVRHRVISRMKNRELPVAEYRPRHAAPEAEEPAEHEEQAADEARTLVVLTPR